MELFGRRKAALLGVHGKQLDLLGGSLMIFRLFLVPEDTECGTEGSNLGEIQWRDKRRATSVGNGCQCETFGRRRRTIFCPVRRLES